MFAYEAAAQRYCMYFYDIRLMHLLIHEIGQLGIITVFSSKADGSVFSYKTAAQKV